MVFPRSISEGNKEERGKKKKSGFTTIPSSCTAIVSMNKEE